MIYCFNFWYLIEQFLKLSLTLLIDIWYMLGSLESDTPHYTAKYQISVLVSLIVYICYVLLLFYIIQKGISMRVKQTENKVIIIGLWRTKWLYAEIYYFHYAMIRLSISVLAFLTSAAWAPHKVLWALIGVQIASFCLHFVCFYESLFH